MFGGRAVCERRVGPRSSRADPRPQAARIVELEFGARGRLVRRRGRRRWWGVSAGCSRRGSRGRITVRTMQSRRYGRPDGPVRATKVGRVSTWAAGGGKTRSGSRREARRTEASHIEWVRIFRERLFRVSLTFCEVVLRKNATTRRGGSDQEIKIRGRAVAPSLLTARLDR